MFLNREEMKEKLAKMKSRRIRRIALVTVAAVGGGALIGQLCYAMLRYMVICIAPLTGDYSEALSA